MKGDTKVCVLLKYIPLCVWNTTLKRVRLDLFWNNQYILHQDLNPRHRDDALSDFNNYIKFYINMSAPHEFTIFVFSIYWKGTEKLSAIHTQSLITRSCYIQTMDKSIRLLPIYPIYFICLNFTVFINQVECMQVCVFQILDMPHSFNILLILFNHRKIHDE